MIGREGDHHPSLGCNAIVEIWEKQRATLEALVEVDQNAVVAVQ